MYIIVITLITVQVISYDCDHKGSSDELEVYVSLGKDRIMEFERGSTRWHCVENSLWMRLWTCCKTGYRMNE